MSKELEALERLKESIQLLNNIEKHLPKAEHYKLNIVRNTLQAQANEIEERAETEQSLTEWVNELTSEIERLKGKLNWALNDCINLNDNLPHPSASDDFVYKREISILKGDNNEENNNNE